jgi:hypothetical protein
MNPGDPRPDRERRSLPDFFAWLSRRAPKLTTRTEIAKRECIDAPLGPSICEFTNPFLWENAKSIEGIPGEAKGFPDLVIGLSQATLQLTKVTERPCLRVRPASCDPMKDNAVGKFRDQERRRD